MRVAGQIVGTTIHPVQVGSGHHSPPHAGRGHDHPPLAGRVQEGGTARTSLPACLPACLCLLALLGLPACTALPGCLHHSAAPASAADVGCSCAPGVHSSAALAKKETHLPAFFLHHPHPPPLQAATLLNGLRAVRQRSCSTCKDPGAWVKCAHSSCRAWFHLLCSGGCLLEDNGGMGECAQQWVGVGGKGVGSGCSARLWCLRLGGGALPWGYPGSTGKPWLYLALLHGPSHGWKVAIHVAGRWGSPLRSGRCAPHHTADGLT